MTPGDLLSERYRLVRELGRGGAAVTWLASDTHTGRPVVVKLLHLGLVGDWKSVELFQREADVLKTLHHPRIPQYVDSFTTELDGDSRFTLVREYVEGRDLQEMVDGGWRGSEDQIREVGIQMADIVSYIHSLRPPVIHRDINPRNIVVRNDREVFLIDFGGVQDAIRLSARSAATMIGTPGYAPMEQFIGRATMRSDLYGCAATLVFLLTRVSTADLPTRGLKLDLPSVIEITSPGLGRVLSNWLEPDEAARTLSIQEARELLAGTETGTAASAAPAVEGDRPPHGSKIVYERGTDDARYILPIGAGRGHRRMSAVGMVWIVFVGFWTWSAVRMQAPLSFLLVSIPFLAIGVTLLLRTLTGLFGKLELQVAAGGVSWSRRFLFASRRRTVPLRDVGESRRDDGLLLDVGARTLRLGQGLSHRELEWLQESIDRSLRNARSLTGTRARTIM
jgi:eukaryotic-like serine/threonine-protein kinase